MDDMVGEMSAGKGWMCTAWLDVGLVWLVTVAVRCCVVVAKIENFLEFARPARIREL